MAESSSTRVACPSTLAIVAILAILAIATSASAQVLRTPALDDPDADEIRCEVSNGTGEAVEVSVAVLDTEGVNRTAFTSCGNNQVQPGATCFYGARLPIAEDETTARCELSSEGGTSEIRLIMAMVDEGPVRQWRHWVEGRPFWTNTAARVLRSPNLSDAGASKVACTVTNATNSTVTLVRGELLDFGGNDRASSTSCVDNQIPAGATCSFAADLPHPSGFGDATRCEVEVAASVADIRVLLHTYSELGTLRSTQEARPASASVFRSAFE